MDALRSAFLEGLHLGARVMSGGREDINPYTAEAAWNGSEARCARDSRHSSEGPRRSCGSGSAEWRGGEANRPNYTISTTIPAEVREGEG